MDKPHDMGPAGWYERRITSVLDRLQEAGLAVLNLAVEDMVFPAPSDAVDAAGQYLEEGNSYYTRPEGHPELRAALLKHLAAAGHIYADDEVAIGPGSRQLLSASLSLLAKPHREALIFAPHPPEYPALITLSGMVPRVVTLDSPFKLSAEDISPNISADTGAICIQSPSQPSGMLVAPGVFPWLLEHTPDDIMIMWDCLFSGLTYANGADGLPHIEGQGKHRALMFGSFSMSFSLSGWRIGYVCGPRHIIKNIVSRQSTLALQPSGFLQRAAASVLENPQPIHSSRTKELIRRRDYVVHRLLGVKGISFWPPEAGFYLFISIDQLLSEVYPDAPSWCVGLLERENVAAVPGEQFGMPRYVRINFAVDEAILTAAVSGIIRFVEHCISLKDTPSPSVSSYLQPSAGR